MSMMEEVAKASDKAARKAVADAGGEVVEEFDLTKGTPISAFRVRLDGDRGMSCPLFLGGKPLCVASDWRAAQIIGSAIGIALFSTKRDGEQEERAW